MTATTEQLVQVPILADVLDLVRTAATRHEFTELPSGLLLDAFTASAIATVHDALSPKNAEKFRGMDLLNAQTVALRLLDKFGA